MLGGISRYLSHTYSYKANGTAMPANQFNFQNRLIDAAINSNNSLNGKHVTIYMNCLVSQVSGSGQELHMKYDESSTEENPVIYAWGKDSSGIEFKNRIYINDIDPYHASPAEMKALHAHLAQQEGGVKSSSIPIDVSMNGYDVNQRIDFVQYLGEWNAMQELAKNPGAALERELLFRSRNPMESRIEKKEEYVLFEDKKQSVFDSKSFLEILGIELDVDINWNADGTSELTESQIQYLKEKYDVENLSRSDFYNLLSELSNMNVISHDDVKNQFIRQADQEVMMNGGFLVASDKYFSQWFDSGNDYLSRFQNEVLMYDYFIEALIDGKTSVKTADIAAVKAYYEKQRDFSNRLADIFEKIKRDDDVQKNRIEKERKSGVNLVGTNVPDTVQEAWNRAEKEAGINGAALEADGKLSQITQLLSMSLVKFYQEGNRDVLGSTEASAEAAVKKALELLGIPRTEAQKKEELFYQAFLRFLSN